MKRLIIVYGLISGILVAGMMWATMPFLHNGAIDFNDGMFYGYTSMVIALSLVFFGIKSYRDNHSNGLITFGRGFKIGILISLIASVMYCISWEICYDTVFSDFGEKYSAHYIEHIKTSGATDAEIKVASEEIAKNFEMYKNPVIRFGMTLMEIFPVGLVVTLISAALLRRKEVLPA
jgi:hypothetical protein